MTPEEEKKHREEHYFHWTEGTVQMASCITCIHRNGVATCEAFPDGIPEEILMADIPHVSPYPGDNGIQYERIPEDFEEE